MEIIYWIIIVYGTTQIITESYAFKFIRDMWENMSDYTKIISILLRCILCTSTWISFLYSKIIFSPFFYIFKYNYIYNTIDLTFFFDGMFGSCIIWFIHLIEKKFIG